eukprot:scaffold381_cov178-Amphora_coffeaeformis.AAC.27
MILLSITTAGSRWKALSTWWQWMTLNEQPPTCPNFHSTTLASDPDENFWHVETLLLFVFAGFSHVVCSRFEAMHPYDILSIHVNRFPSIKAFFYLPVTSHPFGVSRQPPMRNEIGETSYLTMDRAARTIKVCCRLRSSSNQTMPPQQ